MYWARMDMLAAGRLLAATDVLDHRDDVFSAAVRRVASASPTFCA